MKSRHTVCWILVFFCGFWSGAAGAAQPDAAAAKTSKNVAYKPGAAYKKSIAGSGSTIPGSRSTILGSRPRTYIKPKKVTYQEHLDALGSHRFKSPESSFGRGKPVKSTLLSQRSPNTSRKPGSRLKIQKSIGHPNAGIERLEPLSNSELAFLDKLTQTVRANDAATGSQLAQITAGQKRGQKLSKDEYDFLNAVAKKVTDGQASYRLHGIAEKRRDRGK